MVQKSDLGQELAQRPRLDVVIVCLAYLPHPAVWRAVLGNLEVEGLEDDSLSFQDLFTRIRILGQEDELVDSGGKNLLVLGSDEDGGDTDQLKLGDGYNALCEEAVDDVDGDPDGFGQHVVTEVDLEQPVDQRLAHFPGKVVLSVHVVGVGDEALLKSVAFQRMREGKLFVRDPPRAHSCIGRSLRSILTPLWCRTYQVRPQTHP